MKVTDNKDKVSKKGYGWVNVVNKNTEYEHRIGGFTMREGIIDIYDEPNITSFNFQLNGYVYSRIISDKKKQYTDKGLVRMAAKFGREICRNIKINYTINDACS